MNGSFFDNFKKRDILVVFITIIALAGLFMVIRMTRQQDKLAQKELVENSTEETSQESSVKVSSLSYGEKIVINEISSDGVVELFNVGTKSIDIGGYSIYVDTDLAATVPDNTVLNSKGCSTVDTKKSFKAAKDHIIKLYDNNDQLVKAISFGAIPAGESFGCITDGSYEAGLIVSSIGEANIDSAKINEENLNFSVPGGFYEEAFELELSAPEGYKIFYTLDGTTPTTESSEYLSSIPISRPSGASFKYATSDGNGYTYTSNIPSSVDMGTVVNAIAVDTKGKIVESKAESYFIGYNNDTDYVGLPVISLEVPPEEMFGFENGIYVPGKSYYNGYIQKDNSRGNFLRKGLEATGKMEYYETTKDRTYVTNVSVSIFNDERRHAEQKSLLITPNGDYPNGTSLDGFCNKGYKSFVLLSGGWDNYSKVRNYLVNSLAEGTNLITREYSPCIVFINGEYWGLYSLANEYNSEYFKSKYNINDTVITVTTDYVSSQSYSEFYEYVANTDFTIPENYKIVQEMMDVSNYIEFMCANILIGNTRMYSNCSACAFKTVNNTGTGFGDGKWRWAINNVECTMGSPYSFVDDHTRGDYSSAMMNTYLSQGIRENAFFNALLQNDAFQKEFLKTMDNLVKNYFTQERAMNVLDELDKKLSKAATETNKRFSTVDNKQFDVELDRIRNFFSKREKYLKIYTDEYIGKKGNVAGAMTEKATEEVSGEATEESTDSN